MEVIVDTTKGVYKEQIVRCKECKYERDGEEFMWCEHPNGLDSIVKPDDFCSYGEREGE